MLLFMWYVIVQYSCWRNYRWITSNTIRLQYWRYNFSCLGAPILPSSRKHSLSLPPVPRHTPLGNLGLGLDDVDMSAYQNMAASLQAQTEAHQVITLDWIAIIKSSPIHDKISSQLIVSKYYYFGNFIFIHLVLNWLSPFLSSLRSEYLFNMSIQREKKNLKSPSRDLSTTDAKRNFTKKKENSTNSELKDWNTVLTFPYLRLCSTFFLFVLKYKKIVSTPVYFFAGFITS